MTQPKPTTETTAHTGETAGGHGSAAPDGPAYWVVTGISTAVVALALYLAVRYLFWPGETSDDHIKRRILREEES